MTDRTFMQSDVAEQRTEVAISAYGNCNSADNERRLRLAIETCMAAQVQAAGVDALTRAAQALEKRERQNELMGSRYLAREAEACVEIVRDLVRTLDTAAFDRAVAEKVKAKIAAIRDVIICDQSTGAADYGEAETYADNILREAGYSPSGAALAETDK